MIREQKVEILKAEVQILCGLLEEQSIDLERVDRHWKRIALLWNEGAFSGQLRSNSNLRPIRTDLATEQTNRCREYDVRLYQEYCQERGLSQTNDSLIEHAEWMLANGYLPGTVYRRLNSVSHLQRSFGVTPFTATDEGRRLVCSLRLDRKIPRGRLVTALRREDVKQMLFACPDTPIGARDRVAILLLWEIRCNRSCCFIPWESILELQDGTVQIQKVEGLPPLEIPVPDDSDLCLQVALSHWATLTGRKGLVLRPVDRHGRIGSKLDGGGLTLVLKAAALRAGIRGRVTLQSFRRSTLVSKEAICRTGRKGIAA